MKSDFSSDAAETRQSEGKFDSHSGWNVCSDVAGVTSSMNVSL